MSPATERSRYVFTYTAGGKTLYADPRATLRQLLRATQGNFDALLKTALSEADGVEALLAQESAREQLHVATCRTFGVQPFDPATGEGMTETEVATLLRSFLDWLDQTAGPGAASAYRDQTIEALDRLLDAADAVGQADPPA